MDHPQNGLGVFSNIIIHSFCTSAIHDITNQCHIDAKVMVVIRKGAAHFFLTGCQATFVYRDAAAKSATNITYRHHQHEHPHRPSSPVELCGQIGFRKLHTLNPPNRSLRSHVATTPAKSLPHLTGQPGS